MTHNNRPKLVTKGEVLMAAALALWADINGNPIQAEAHEMEETSPTIIYLAQLISERLHAHGPSPLDVAVDLFGQYVVDKQIIGDKVNQ